jgi:hypothetical protein
LGAPRLSGRFRFARTRRGRRFPKDIEGLFVRMLELAREMGTLKLGTVAAGRH